jgi:3-deoxy-D-manno-octulosonate 8-phosphate phosphatase (KDO 8-P phosphatase)
MPRGKSRNTKDLFKKVKLLLLDVDGVLTRGEIIYDSHGGESKIFNVKDGLGVVLLAAAGIKTIIITAKDGPVVRRRARDMKIAQVFAGILPKEQSLPLIKKQYKVSEGEMCFMGDDLLDLGLMKKVGVPVTVGDAPSVIKKAAAYVTERYGGEGAVREVVDLIIEARGLGDIISRFLKV